SPWGGNWCGAFRSSTSGTTAARCTCIAPGLPAGSIRPADLFLGGDGPRLPRVAAVNRLHELSTLEGRTVLDHHAACAGREAEVNKRCTFCGRVHLPPVLPTVECRQEHSFGSGAPNDGNAR